MVKIMPMIRPFKVFETPKRSGQPQLNRNLHKNINPVKNSNFFRPAQFVRPMQAVPQRPTPQMPREAQRVKHDFDKMIEKARVKNPYAVYDLQRLQYLAVRDAMGENRDIELSNLIKNLVLKYKLDTKYLRMLDKQIALKYRPKLNEQEKTHLKPRSQAPMLYQVAWIKKRSWI